MPYKVVVRFCIPGFHRWPEAPDECDYLRSLHHHFFKYKVELSVPHGRRAVEVHWLRNLCVSLAEGETVVVTKSCEQLAERLAVQLLQNFPHSKVAVEVWEDQYVGARYESE